jgi:hypothetical protein
MNMRRQQPNINNNNTSSTITQEASRRETVPDMAVVRENIERSNFIDYTPIMPRNSNGTDDAPANTTTVPTTTATTPTSSDVDITSIPEAPRMPPNIRRATELQDYTAQCIRSRMTGNNNNNPHQQQPFQIPNHLSEQDRINIETLNNLQQGQQTAANHFHHNIDVYTELAANVRALRQNTAQILAQAANWTFTHPWISLGVVFGLGGSVWYILAGRAAIRMTGRFFQSSINDGGVGTIITALTAPQNSRQGFIAQRDTRYFVTTIAQIGGILFMVRACLSRFR